MEINKLQFSIDIHSERNKIWSVLWSDKSYRMWADVFFKGSYVVADNWKVGSTVLFLAPDQSGIFSTIEKHNPSKTIRFKHIGNVVQGKKQPINEETKKWSGAYEMYSLTEINNGHKLSVEIDVMDEHLDFMNEKLPEALEKIKSLAENH